MKQILVPTDFSKCADEALSTAISFCKKNDTKLHIVHCYNASAELIGPDISAPFPGIPGSMSGQQFQDFFDTQMAQLETRLEERKTLCQKQGVDPDTSIVNGSLHSELQKKAAELSTDLIIMGSHGAKRLEDQLLGSNAQKVVRMLKTPVLTLKKAIENDGMIKVAFFSTFSDEGERSVFNQYAEMFKKLVKHTHFVFVNTPNGFVRSGEIQQKMKDFSLQSWPSHYDFTVYNDFSFEEGVTNFCKEHKVDAILLATHANVGLQRLLHRSATEQVVNHTELPVLSWHLPEGRD